MADEERNERCETCRFWDHCDGLDEENEAVSTDSYGYCHRYPPVPVVGADSVISAMRWALPVLIGSDFCGEWKAKEKPKTGGGQLPW